MRVRNVSVTSHLRALAARGRAHRARNDIEIHSGAENGGPVDLDVHAPPARNSPKQGAPSTGQMREAAGSGTQPHASGDLEGARREVEGGEDLG